MNWWQRALTVFAVAFWTWELYDATFLLYGWDSVIILTITALGFGFRINKLTKISI
jgi:hypothetical protein